MRRWMTAAAVVVWLVAGMSWGQELDQLVPGDGTVVFVQWKGVEALRGDYEQSRLKKVVDESNLPLVFSEFLPRVVEKIEKDSPLDAQVLGNWMGAMEVLGRYPTAIWWGGFVKSAERRPLPRLAVVCQAGEQAAAVRDKLAEALGDHANKWTIGIDQGWLWITPAPYAEPFQRELKEDGPLAKQAGYQQARGRVMRDATLLVYLDGENLGGVLKREKSAAEAFAALGLNNLRYGLAAAGFDGADWRCEAFIDAPAPRSGLLSLLDSKPLSDELLNRVPATAYGMTTARLSLFKVLDETRTALGKMDPKARQQFNKMLGFATMMLGVNVEMDLIAAFGDEWLVYDDPRTAGGGVLGAVLVNHLADAAKAHRSLDAAARLINSFMAGRLRNTPATVAVRQVQSGDVTISYLALPAISPAWAIKDGFLYLSFYPEVTAQAMRARTDNEKSIRDNPAFVEMQKRLGVAKGVTAVGFHDLPKSASRAYPVVLMLSRAWLGMGDFLGLQAPEMILPPLGKIVPQLTPSGSATWVDEAGWHYRAISPFPGSGIFGGEMEAVASQYPVLAAAIIPALERARESARQAACLSQMRQLAMALYMYANEHKGHLPPDLGSLLPYFDGNALLMICPEAQNNLSSAPADPQARPRWVDEHTSYEYLMPNVKLSTVKESARQIMLREKSAVHEGKMNVLFADGHAVAMWPYEMENLIDAGRQQAGEK